MDIAIDISPIQDNKQHAVRGSGSYVRQLVKSLKKYFPNYTYTLFTRGKKISKNTSVVHYPYFDAFFLTLPYFKDFKTVVTVHDLTPLVFPAHFPAGIKGRFKWLIQKINLGRMDAIITDSHASKKDISEFTNIPSNKIHVIHLAAGEEFQKLKVGSWVEQLRIKYSLPDKFLLYTGDATWNKNLLRLVHAVKQTPYTLIMVGKALASKTSDNVWDRELSAVQEFIKNDSQFLSIGYVEQTDLVMLYNLATVFVYPSLYEGFGLPVLEAMSCGCPVIATTRSSLKEVGGDAIYVIDPEDTISIVNAIKNMMEDSKLRQKFSKKGLDHAKLFTWEKTAQETISIYKYICEKR